ncbi:hypothetical protein AB0L80_04265 [Streptomyces sp. NPDC052069]|uniref:hypothetical protein n=1 Tax=Streptomyces sp. NPDC052069 TaxID=3154650 RepID=UPI003425BDBD
MAHALIASTFLDGHLLLKPGARADARISADHFEGLRQAAIEGESLPVWAVQELPMCGAWIWAADPCRAPFWYASRPPTATAGRPGRSTWAATSADRYPGAATALYSWAFRLVLDQDGELMA